MFVILSKSVWGQGFIKPGRKGAEGVSEEVKKRARCGSSERAGGEIRGNYPTMLNISQLKRGMGGSQGGKDWSREVWTPCPYSPASLPPPPPLKKKIKYDLRFVTFSFAVDLVFNSRWWQFANHVYHGHNHSRKKRKQTLAARRIQLILRTPGGEHLLMLGAEVYEYEEVFQTQYLFRQSGVFIFHS